MKQHVWHKTVWYVAGKSGGHIIPALTHAQEFLQTQTEAHENYELLFFSTASALDCELLKKSALVNQHKPLPLGNIPRGISLTTFFAWPKFMVQLFISMVTILAALYRSRPTKVVSMGGYVSVPVCLVAWLFKIPVELFELNVVPGAAVKLLSRFATTTHCCFNQTKALLPKQAAAQLSTYPLRYSEHDRVSKQDACKKLGIDPRRKIICVLGGSQGSQFINSVVTQAAQHLSVDDYFFIHQTGAQNVAGVEKAYQDLGLSAMVFAFRDDIQLCYCAADALVARAGAGTLFEILFFGKRACIIPLQTTTTDHQIKNATALAEDYPDIFEVCLQEQLASNPEILGNFFVAVTELHDTLHNSASPLDTSTSA